jgi:hypothetical protein
MYNSVKQFKKNFFVVNIQSVLFVSIIMNEYELVLGIVYTRNICLLVLELLFDIKVENFTI